MAKKLFRFLRGELNGYYITRINNALNGLCEDIESLFISFKHMQFNIATMSEDTIYNIGLFAGVHLVRLSTGEAYGAMRMTEGYRDSVTNTERSERGLLKRENESFEFFHTASNTYAQDINTLATQDRRSSLTGDEEIVGYIDSNNLDVLDEDGNVKPSAVLSEPPANSAYSDFYGNQFLFLSDSTEITKNINIVLFIELYKIMQYIRYNGVNIKSFIQMVSILCPSGLVTVEGIRKALNQPYFEVLCHYNLETEIEYVQQRLNTLEYLVGLKFPQFMLTQVED